MKEIRSKRIVLSGALIGILALGACAPAAAPSPAPTKPPATVPTTAAAATPTRPAAAPTTAAPAARGDATKGQAVYQRSGCSGCHKVKGEGGAVGPDLSTIGTTAATRKAGMSAADYLRESETNPGAFVVSGFQNVMPPTPASGADLDDLIAYLLSLK
ncbi:MAG: cytochrome c [Chloroflexi bacterium]|nr:cytochrome c [Chloroflexota bacterium]